VIVRDGNGDLFVGPDNGLLVPAADLGGIESAHELTNPAYALEPVSRTFHGRDLFAPAAAHLARRGQPVSPVPALDEIASTSAEALGELRAALKDLRSDGLIVEVKPAHKERDRWGEWVNMPATENALFLGLAAIGLHPEQIGRVIISHGHPDHYGMAPRLQELSGCRVLIDRDRTWPRLKSAERRWQRKATAEDVSLADAMPDLGLS